MSPSYHAGAPEMSDRPRTPHEQIAHQWRTQWFTVQPSRLLGFSTIVTPSGERLPAVGTTEAEARVLRLNDGLKAARGVGPAGTLAEVERSAIRATLKQTDGRLSEAARILGISRTTLWRKLKRYGQATR